MATDLTTQDPLALCGAIEEAMTAITPETLRLIAMARGVRDAQHNANFGMGAGTRAMDDSATAARHEFSKAMDAHQVLNALLVLRAVLYTLPQLAVEVRRLVGELEEAKEMTDSAQRRANYWESATIVVESGAATALRRLVGEREADLTVAARLMAAPLIAEIGALRAEHEALRVERQQDRVRLIDGDALRRRLIAITPADPQPGDALSSEGEAIVDQMQHVIAILDAARAGEANDHG